jgi:hypothetical protein
MNAANLARDLLDVLEHYLSLALVCAVQAVELRAKLTADTFDARLVLSPARAAFDERIGAQQHRGRGRRLRHGLLYRSDWKRGRYHRRSRSVARDCCDGVFVVVHTIGGLLPQRPA